MVGEGENDDEDKEEEEDDSLPESNADQSERRKKLDSLVKREAKIVAEDNRIRKLDADAAQNRSRLLR